MKYYKREGRRFVEAINPADRIGMYVDNSGLFFTKDKTQSSVGKCVMIEDGHYVIACIEDRSEKLTFTETLRCKWKICIYNDRVLNHASYDTFIPSIGLLSYTVCKYPDLFNKRERYMSSSSFYAQPFNLSLVNCLVFYPYGKFWLHDYADVNCCHLSIKLFYKIPIL